MLLAAVVLFLSEVVEKVLAREVATVVSHLVFVATVAVVEAVLVVMVAA